MSDSEELRKSQMKPLEVIVLTPPLWLRTVPDEWVQDYLAVCDSLFVARKWGHC